MATDVTCLQCGKPYDASIVANRFAGVCPACLAKFAAASDEVTSGPVTADPSFKPPLKMGSTFHGLEVVELLGAGGMGVVYKARQPGLDRHVALKVLSPKMSDDPEFVARFNREAKAMAALSHPGIVQIHDYGKEADLCFLVMEFVEGVSLRQLMNEGRLPPEKALAIVPQLCEALQFAHGRGVIHRDIKPENILLNRDGRVKVADFGLARVLDSGGDPRVTISNVVMGTPGYMAPEQYHSMKVDHRADIYSLGVVFYEMLTGALPVGPFDPPSKRVQIDFRLDEVVLKSLEREPERRYQQASDVKTDLDAVTSQGGAPEGYCDAAEARRHLGVDATGLGKLIEDGRVRAYPFRTAYRFRRDELAGMTAFVGDHQVRKQGRLASASLICLVLALAAASASNEIADDGGPRLFFNIASAVLALISILMAAGALTSTPLFRGRIFPKLGAVLVICVSGVFLVAMLAWSSTLAKLRKELDSRDQLTEVDGRAPFHRFGLRISEFVSPNGFRVGQMDMDGRSVARAWSAWPETRKQILENTPLAGAEPGDVFAAAGFPYRFGDVGLYLWFAEARSERSVARIRARMKAAESDCVDERRGILFGVRLDRTDATAKAARDQLMEAARDIFRQ